MPKTFGKAYEAQVALLLEVLPIVNREPKFALKGGTAINLFVRNFPRLSIDIDLAYIPIAPRRESVMDINLSLGKIAAGIRKAILNSHVRPTQPIESDKELKLIVELNGTAIRIEPNYIMRSCVFPVEKRELSSDCARHFGVSMTSNIVSFEDLYGGKICAALDRQHPRDLFDIHILLANEGLTEGVRQAFLVYLMGHNRPMNELLNPKWKDQSRFFEAEFLGMTNEALSQADLETAGRQLIHTVMRDLTEAERKFLIDFKLGQPNWDDFFRPDIQQFPAIVWKQLNLNRMASDKRRQAAKKLESILF